MRHFKFYLSMLAVSALLFTSCSKDDPGSDPDPKNDQMVTLSFKGALQQFEKAMATKQIDEDTQLPGCSADQNPAYVKVGIKKADNTFVNNGPITINVIPDSTASGTYLTFESADLELAEGSYSLEYFGVYNDGPDGISGNADDEMIWLAPRGDEDYGPANFGNFVKNALPIDIELKEGTKHYVDVEVLCYDEAEARQYGYLFFEFEDVPLTYLCVFGNECDEDGRHTPSHFRVKIWEYPEVNGSNIVFTDANALVNEVNEVRTLESGLLQADPLCFPLPDRDGTNLFYGEIWTIAADGTETRIRRGDFTDEDTKSDDFNIDNDENLRNYWHFREGPFCGEDSSPCLLGSLGEDIIDDFDDPADFSEYTGTSYDEFGSSTDRYGEYLITDNAKNFYSGFPNEGYDGNMIVFDGDPNRELVYYTIETPEVCAGDRYYVKMDMRDISDPNVNNTRLRVNYRSGADDALTISQFTIDELEDNGKATDWKTVGFTMEARSNGQLYFFIKDMKTANSGNDFAMDNVIISTNPSILNGIPSGNINPNN